MKTLTNKDYLLNIITDSTVKFLQNNFSIEYLMTATKLMEKTNILRNNISLDINKLHKEGYLVKVKSRPVFFLALNNLKEINKNIKLEYSSVGELVDDLHNYDYKSPNKSTAFSDLIGYNSDLIKQVKQAKAAVMYPPNGLNLIITGDTGTGKSYFAYNIAKYALEKGVIDNLDKYVVFNCADYTENKQLLLAKLFGYKKGAYTGAEADQIGIVEKANNGILFLDEIHRLPPEGQEMLFSILDYGRFMPMGENSQFHYVKFLLICATTESLDKYILKTFLRRIPIRIHLPNLDNRTMDVRLMLINNFFYQESIAIKKKIIVNKAILKILLMYHLEGNIGQLKNDIKLMCANAYIESTFSDIYIYMLIY